MGFLFRHSHVIGVGRVFPQVGTFTENFSRKYFFQNNLTARFATGNERSLALDKQIDVFSQPGNANNGFALLVLIESKVAGDLIYLFVGQIFKKIELFDTLHSKLLNDFL
jgi:hypothetical protein